MAKYRLAVLNTLMSNSNPRPTTLVVNVRIHGFSLAFAGPAT